MSDCYLVKTMGGFKAADEETQCVIQSYGSGEIVRVKFFKDRNPKHHRLFFGLLNLVFGNQEQYLSREALRFAITIQAGYVEEIILSGGRTALRPKSLSFGSMNQTEFSEFYAAALKAIPELLPQFEGVDIEHELMICA